MPPEYPENKKPDQIVAVGRWKPEGGKTFNPESAKQQIIFALDAAITRCSKEMTRVEGLDNKEVRAVDAGTLNRYVQELAVAKTFIEQGNFAGVLDDPKLLNRVQKETKDSIVRALKRLAGRM